jgi:hypothetical protein
MSFSRPLENGRPRKTLKQYHELDAEEQQNAMGFEVRYKRIPKTAPDEDFVANDNPAIFISSTPKFRIGKNQPPTPRKGSKISNSLTPYQDQAK